MTDRELLELAAKAAGVDLYEKDVFTTGLTRRVNGHGVECWHPLIKDDDGARLESALALDVRWQEHHVIVGRNHGDAWQEPFALHGGDKQAARRYAAVRSAAEIGKAVQKPLAP